MPPLFVDALKKHRLVQKRKIRASRRGEPIGYSLDCGDDGDEGQRRLDLASVGGSIELLEGQTFCVGPDCAPNVPPPPTASPPSLRDGRPCRRPGNR